nr:MAG TPA: hypothetical protein [Caudoviricetes sp.]
MNIPRSDTQRSYSFLGFRLQDFFFQLSMPFEGFGQARGLRGYR